MIKNRTNFGLYMDFFSGTEHVATRNPFIPGGPLSKHFFLKYLRNFITGTVVQYILATYLYLITFSIIRIYFRKKKTPFFHKELDEISLLCRRNSLSFKN